MPVKSPTAEQVRKQIEFVRLKMISREAAQARAVAGDAELRRGAVALNGAGLVAIVGLLSGSIPAAVVRAGATNFAVGLAIAIAVWVCGEIALASTANVHAAADRGEALLEAKTDAEVDAALKDPATVAQLRELLTASRAAYGQAALNILGLAASMTYFGLGIWKIIGAL